MANGKQQEQATSVTATINDAQVKLTKDDMLTIVTSLELLQTSYDRRTNMKGTEDEVKTLYRHKASKVGALIAHIRQTNIAFDQ